MYIKEIVRAMIYLVVFMLPDRTRANHEGREMLHYHPFLFGKTQFDIAKK